MPIKSLWLVSNAGIPNKTYEGSKYRLGWFNEETKEWQGNDQPAVDLLALLKALGWGDPDNGDVPDLEIHAR